MSVQHGGYIHDDAAGYFDPKCPSCATEQEIRRVQEERDTARAQASTLTAEHQRVQAEAAAMRDALSRLASLFYVDPGTTCEVKKNPLGDEVHRLPHGHLVFADTCAACQARQALTSTDAGAALLKEVEGLRRERNELCAKGRESAQTGARLVCEMDAMRAESARVQVEFAQLARESDDCLTPDEALAQLGLIKQEHTAEVRRAVEQEREACAVVADGLGCVGVGFAIRARGEGPRKINRQGPCNSVRASA